MVKGITRLEDAWKNEIHILSCKLKWICEMTIGKQVCGDYTYACNLKFCKEKRTMKSKNVQ